MHVYCVDCINYINVESCMEDDVGVQLCSDCPCDGCECRNPEDSMSIKIRPKYEI